MIEAVARQNPGFITELLTTIPHLRAYARSLTRNRDAADDLSHDAIVRALDAAEQYTPGTNFRAWIFTILRHMFYNNSRRNKYRMVPLEDMPPIESVTTTSGQQEANLAMCDFRRAFWQLNPEHREVLMLIGAGGLSYEEAAVICNCQIGTIKSRVSRARSQLNLTLEQGALPSRSSVQPIAESEFIEMLEDAGHS
ncbi:MAG TPA: sigma-70 family RNA polymerase sigma factor [Dongiaceae bacterium]|jgi:RNA polymerase sigma-70 factor (ECF subfamily)|nr:sigma-70 family RNA polymerase sigma factor [Dongiaceae bacterium]